MNKRVFFALALLVLALVAVAGCAPVPATPTAAPTTASVTETPAPPTAEAVPLTAEAAPLTVEPGPVPPSARPTVPAPVEGQRPLAEVPAAERNDRFSGPAASYVMSDTIYVATIVTDKGNIVAELYQDTPEGQNNFVTLALNGFYDGLTFHRVEPGFVIQGGDPEGTGRGGPGYTIKDEVNGRTHVEGAVAMAKMPRPDTAGSQFYICLARTPHLDKDYTVFGKVTSGMDAVRKIESEKAGTMTKVTIAEKRPGSTYAPAKLNEKAPADEKK